MKRIAYILIALMMIGALTGCGPDTNVRLKEQNAKKEQIANNLMEKHPVPSVDYSTERENIRQRLLVTNNPSQIGWVYLLGGDSTVVARLPARGKVTSSNKRLSSPEMPIFRDGYRDLVQAPDEMGAYGSSNEYVFFFTPNGMLVQWSGEYMYTSEPYMMNPKTKQIEYTVDEVEMARLDKYKEQVKNVPIDKVKGGQ